MGEAKGPLGPHSEQDYSWVWGRQAGMGRRHPPVPEGASKDP